MYGYGCDPCYPGVGYPGVGAGFGPGFGAGVGPGFGYPVAGAFGGGCGFSGGFALIVVLFILLVIIGASCIGFC
ncbi:YjcZ family sporulation protein [Bacillus sp. Bva_UNVM-123]|uniref:YjcZ family sporulation protein n=1 Tax=Bacillus sp. Bva_UNVM-123 TaxID=2829798 RepID=UPI00391F8685